MKALDDGADHSHPDVACITKLLQALDDHLPDPPRDTQAPFLMPIEGVCSVPGRGTVATGRIERGAIALHDSVELIGGVKGITASMVVIGIESFHRSLAEGLAGHNVGICFVVLPGTTARSCSRCTG